MAKYHAVKEYVSSNSMEPHSRIVSSEVESNIVSVATTMSIFRFII